MISDSISYQYNITNEKSRLIKDFLSWIISKKLSSMNVNQKTDEFLIQDTIKNSIDHVILSTCAASKGKV